MIKEDASVVTTNDGDGERWQLIIKYKTFHAYTNNHMFIIY